MVQKKLILFDVDGTLTKPRIKIEDNMLDTIKKLKDIDNLDIGIVGGSDLKKQEEQIGKENLALFDYIFAENGLHAFHNNILMHHVSFLSVLPEKHMNFLINLCLKELAQINIPRKRGTFIEWRNGMLNISPIGRDCNQKERDEFYELDKKFRYREKLIMNLKLGWTKHKKKYSHLNVIDLEFSVGGQISIDIFPKGWNKTFCLQFVKHEYNEIYFLGDKTTKGGNDYEIFNHETTTSYAVNSPDYTIKLLNKLFMLV